MPLWLQFLLFLAVALGVVGLGHYYLWKRLARDTGLSRSLGHVLRALFVLGIIAFPLERIITNTVGGTVSVVFAWIGYGWLGFCFYTVLLLCLVDFVLLLVWRRRARDDSPHVTEDASSSFDPERRRTLRRLLNGGAAALSSGVLVYGAREAFSEPEITELVVPLRGLPRALSGFTIVQLSDVHIGALVDYRFLQRMVTLVNKLKPDLVAVTGDLFDRQARGLGREFAELARLRAKVGTYFVTGNHEFYVGAEVLCAALRGLGFGVLRNERVVIGTGSDSFDLIGVDDWSAGRRPVRAIPGMSEGRYDLEAALAGRDPERAAVLLAHQPRDFERAAARGVGLQLSGHTHGGQMFPIILISRLVYPRVAGHYRLGDAHMYVSRGVGFWGPPFRVLAPPEIVRVTLV